GGGGRGGRGGRGGGGPGVRGAGPRGEKAAMWPPAPGRLAPHSATASIQSMPSFITCQHGASNPNGSAKRPRMPAGITTAETTGMASRLASTPYGARRWEWEAAYGGVGRPATRGARV